MTYEEAETLALKAIHDGGRGMIGAGRNHLHQRVARAILDAARSEAQPSGYDGSKSLGERLFDAVAAAEPGSKVVPWSELDPDVQTKMEKAALTFTASLSDASPKPAEGDA